MQQAIVDFALDDENHWYAILACGHTQHVRHDPPWQNRPWVITEQGRKEKLGVMLECKKCDERTVIHQLKCLCDKPFKMSCFFSTHHFILSK